jgi:hypothetical protein
VPLRKLNVNVLKTNVERLRKRRRDLLKKKLNVRKLVLLRERKKE